MLRTKLLLHKYNSKRIILSATYFIKIAKRHNEYFHLGRFCKPICPTSSYSSVSNSKHLEKKKKKQGRFPFFRVEVTIEPHKQRCNSFADRRVPPLFPFSTNLRTRVSVSSSHRLPATRGRNSRAAVRFKAICIHEIRATRYKLVRLPYCSSSRSSFVVVSRRFLAQFLPLSSRVI